MRAIHAAPTTVRRHRRAARRTSTQAKDTCDWLGLPNAENVLDAPEFVSGHKLRRLLAAAEALCLLRAVGRGGAQLR